MNILPKKSWHVLNKDNIERVRRDEARARAEEEEKAGRAALAEKEARLGAMRKRARARDREDEDGEDSGLGREKEREGGSRKQRRECSVTDASGHINFFSDLQKGVGLQVGNVEREKEMKQEQEKLEKRIGLLNYLVDKDKSDTAPWYARSAADSSRGTASKLDAVKAVVDKRQSAKAEHRKELLDPLLNMQQYIKAKKKNDEVYGKDKIGSHGQHHNRGASAVDYDREIVSKQDTKQHHRAHSEEEQGRKTKKHKRKERERETEEAKERDKRENKKKKEKEREREREKKQQKGGDEELERLRRERRKREGGERAKAEALIRGLQGGGRELERSESLAVETVHGRYNSQFNPHLARQQY